MDKLEYDENMKMVDNYIANTTPEECYNDLVEAGAKPMGYNEMMQIFDDHLANITPEQFLAELKECGEGCQSWEDAGVRLATSTERVLGNSISRNPAIALRMQGKKLFKLARTQQEIFKTYRP